MEFMKIGLLLFWLVFPLSANDIYLSEASKGRPADIKAILERVVMCIHFRGEEGYDAERRAFLKKKFAELRCSRVDRDLNAIKKKYSHSKKQWKILTKSEEILPD
nr:hypothetical protein [Leptospira alstonii]